jgi:8-oxo-dGTP pyrophosphatase MutT (NUDIX family)
MANEKVKKVGLLIITRTKEEKLVAVLQRRSHQNHEKDWGDKSFPYGCQLTAAGRVNDDESPEYALSREIEEELGSEISNQVALTASNPCQRFYGDDTGEKYTFAMFVDRKILDLIRWHPSTGGPVFVDLEGVTKIQNLRDYDKAIGVIYTDVVAMFPDEKEVVRQALEFKWD